MNCTDNDSIIIVASEDPRFSAEDLTADEQVRFQVALGELLEKRVKLYTSGDSTSVPELTAHRLLSSVLFTLTIDPDDLSPIEVRKILCEGIDKRFDRKLKELENKINLSSTLWTEASLSTPLLESRALKDTLKSMQQLKGVYDYRYFAHEIPADIDYPLAHPVPEDILGIDYINEYLKRLIIENNFMQNFDVKNCSQLLRKIHPDYRSLLINLFEPIATNALGLAIAGEDVFSLAVDDETRACIENKLKDRSRKEIITELQRAASYLSDLTRTTDDEARSYLEQTARALYPRLVTAFARGGLEGIFVSLR